MLNLNKTIRYTLSEKDVIDQLLTRNGGPWASNMEKMVKIKTRIRKRLTVLQKNRCAYCGLELGETSRDEIEHIAPKHEQNYWIFTAHHQNLVLSCSFCNGSSCKGSTDPVESYSTTYDHCTFWIVHPYFDNPDDHYHWVNGVEVFILPISDKGRASIKMFKLDQTKRTLGRAKDLNNKSFENRFPLTEIQEEMIRLAMSSK